MTLACVFGQHIQSLAGHIVDVMQVEAMEDAAGKTVKAVQRLTREGKPWGVIPWLRDSLDAFKKTLPLINDLRNDAMRQRHWQQLQDHIGARWVWVLLGCAASNLAAPGCMDA